MPILIGAGAFVLVIGIIGAFAAGSDKETGVVSDSPTQVQPTVQPTTTVSKPKAPPAPKKPTTAAFGETFTYTDGLSVTVASVEPYTPSQYAAGTRPGDEAIIATVKIRNRTKEPFDTSLFSLNVKAGADGVAGDSIFDDNSGDGFSGTIVPGSVATAKFAFDIPRGATGMLDIEAQPDSTVRYESWHWVGKMP